MQVSVNRTRRTAVGSRLVEDALAEYEAPFGLELGLSEDDMFTLTRDGALTVTTGKPDGPNGEVTTVYTMPDLDDNQSACDPPADDYGTI